MKLSDKNLKILTHVARLLLGLTFVFSGFVKAIDPLGSTYKIEDYLDAFGWVYFKDFSFLMSVLLSATEFFLGIALLIGVYKHSISLMLFLFMIFLTPLTLYIAIANPVTDCGCFGDALVLSNTATFIKNLVLLVLAFFVYFNNDKFITFFGRHTSRYTAFWCALFPLLLSTWSYRHLPLIDFLPYKVGNNLPSLMKAPAGAPTDSITTIFIYEKNGKQKKFTLDKAPFADTTWKFVDREDIAVRQGYRSPIHDFVLELPEQGDITNKVLTDHSYTFLFVSNKLEDMNYNHLQEILDVKSYANQHGYRFLALTNSSPRGIEDWKYEYDDAMTFCSLDDRTLKTMIRSNPGLILIKDGTVYQKWGFRDVPVFAGEKRPLEKTPYGTIGYPAIGRLLGGLLFVLTVPLIFFFLLHSGYRFRYNKHSLKWFKFEKIADKDSHNK
ncbi:MAG TPA: BT_3928 family protein [Bacteroidales bacterium]|nr:BT_3928 family protein [Bacteroidales bacterium]